MNNNVFNADAASLSVDLSEARQAVKENRFQDALDLFEIILETDPDHIDSLYLVSVSSRYLKKFDESRKYIERLLFIAPDMGRAYQELGHIYRDMGNLAKAAIHYRQACELNPADAYFIRSLSRCLRCLFSSTNIYYDAYFLFFPFYYHFLTARAARKIFWCRSRLDAEKVCDA